MPVQRKVFRIEQMNPVATLAMLFADGTAASVPQDEILAELKALRDLFEQRTRDVARQEPAPIDAAQIDASAMHRLRLETDRIHDAISRTKQEIATLQASAFDRVGRAHLTRELDAVADGARCATERILDATEAIDDAANSLVASLRREQERALAQDIQDHAIQIFEACNFQDLSGQRIAKVIATLRFVEERVASMMEIWGGMEAFKDLAAAAAARRDSEVKLHGPKLDGDPGHATQDDVDALFASG